MAGQEGDFEHWVFDNCSTDNTASEVAKFPNVRFVSEPDRGQSHAVNKGFAAARGGIICWLNADDAYPPGLFGRLREVFSDPDCSVVFGDVEQVARDGHSRERVQAVFEDRLDLVRWWTSKARLHQPAIFFRRAVIERVGLLREDLHYAMDYEYWWRVSEFFAFHAIPDILAIQHRQPESKTIRAWDKVYEERARIFAPFYSLIDGGDREALLTEKRKVLAGRYVLNAWASLESDRSLARRNIALAWREDPWSILKIRNLGLLRAWASASR